MNVSAAANATQFSSMNPRVPAVDRLIEERLRSCGYRSLRGISCHECDGVAYLHGCLPSYYLKQPAQEIAVRMDGVRLVINNIEATVPERGRRES